ncbi:unnamed protein product [Urochloa humidicola]
MNHPLVPDPLSCPYDPIHRPWLKTASLGTLAPKSTPAHSRVDWLTSSTCHSRVDWLTSSTCPRCIDLVSPPAPRHPPQRSSTNHGTARCKLPRRAPLPPSDDTPDADHGRLHELGYKQELKPHAPPLGVLSNFSISTVVVIYVPMPTGVTTLYNTGLTSFAELD